MARRDYSRSPGGPGDLIHAPSSWIDGEVVFEHRRFAAPRADHQSSSSSDLSHHRFVLTEAGETSRTRVLIGGRTIYDGADCPGAVSFMPALSERTSSYWDADLRFSCLWVSPATMSSLSKGLRLMPLPVVNGDDEVVGTLLRSLSSALAAGRRPGAVYAEHLAALALLRMADPGPDPQGERSPGKLDQKSLGTVLEYIDANLASDIRLSHLAALLGLQTDSFARRFRATTGQPPYRYVLGRRVERGAALLRATDTSISEVALTTGFSNQSHFTSVFKQLTGTTPSAYRRRYRPGS